MVRDPARTRRDVAAGTYIRFNILKAAPVYRHAMNVSLPVSSNFTERSASAVAVVVIHMAFGYLILTGFGVDVVESAQRKLTALNLSPPQPPSPPVEPRLLKSKEPQGVASAKNLKAKASPVLATKPVLEPPIKSDIPAAQTPRDGTDRSAGASNERGPGSGAGGQGDGSGAGGRGNGGGGLIVVSRARLISGAIDNKDYPRGAARANIGGTVVAFYTVLANGRVTGCQIRRSSGNGELDATTCRLIEKRFRYDPARDSNGNAIADITGWQQRWWLGNKDQAEM